MCATEESAPHFEMLIAHGSGHSPVAEVTFIKLAIRFCVFATGLLWSGSFLADGFVSLLDCTRAQGQIICQG